MMNKRDIKQYIRLTCLILALSCLGYSSNSMAQVPPIAETACDPTYYDSLEARAWLEAQREITQNQNLIYKPDSVLEYTCFDQFTTLLKAGSTVMFSDNPDRWDGIAEGGLSDAVSSLVETTHDDYLNANFDYDGDQKPINDLLNMRETNFPIPAGAYTCNVMREIWLKAKCYDFIHTHDTDGFFTFSEYASGSDMRQLPSACPAIQARWQNEQNNAFDHDTTVWQEDDIVTFFEKLDPANCNGADTIATGITIRRAQEPRTYQEKVCLAPGCYYVPTADGGSCKPVL